MHPSPNIWRSIYSVMGHVGKYEVFKKCGCIAIKFSEIEVFLEEKGNILWYIHQISESRDRQKTVDDFKKVSEIVGDEMEIFS